MSLQRYVFFEKKDKNIWLKERKSVILPTESKKNCFLYDKNGKLLVVA